MDTDSQICEDDPSRPSVCQQVSERRKNKAGSIVHFILRGVRPGCCWRAKSTTTSSSERPATMLLGVIANKAAFVGMRAIAARSFATVGSQIPSVVLHSWVCLRTRYVLFLPSCPFRVIFYFSICSWHGVSRGALNWRLDVRLAKTGCYVFHRRIVYTWSRKTHTTHIQLNLPNNFLSDIFSRKFPAGENVSTTETTWLLDGAVAIESISSPFLCNPTPVASCQ